MGTVHRLDARFCELAKERMTDRLRSEIAARRKTIGDAFLEQWADIFEEECKRLPSLRDTMGMT